MAFIEAQAVRAILLIALLAVVFTGVSFAGLAGYLALAAVLPPWAAAAIVAIVLLGIALVAALIVRSRARPVARPARVEPAAAAQSPDAIAMQAIAGMAQEKPLLAVLVAGLLGAAGTIMQHKNRVH